MAGSGLVTLLTLAAAGWVTPAAASHRVAASAGTAAAANPVSMTTDSSAFISANADANLGDPDVDEATKNGRFGAFHPSPVSASQHNDAPTLPEDASASASQSSTITPTPGNMTDIHTEGGAEARTAGTTHNFAVAQAATELQLVIKVTQTVDMGVTGSLDVTGNVPNDGCAVAEIEGPPAFGSPAARLGACTSAPTPHVTIDDHVTLHPGMYSIRVYANVDQHGAGDQPGTFTARSQFDLDIEFATCPGAATASGGTTTTRAEPDQCDAIGHVVFDRHALGKKPDAFVLDGAGENPALPLNLSLTRDTAETDLTLSPDGTRIAFSRGERSS